MDERKFSFVIYVAIVSRKRVSRSITRRTEDQSLGGRYADEKFHKTEKESWISNDLNSFVFRTLSLFFSSLCYDNLHIDFFGENVSRNSQETPPPPPPALPYDVIELVGPAILDLKKNRRNAGWMY